MHIPGLVTLIGSGEASAGMVKVHRQLLQDFGRETPRPVFLETPAGFEQGVEAIAARFQEYFQSSLGLELRLARYRNRNDSPAGQAEALAALAEADYIVAGPGSPTYAIDQLRDTPILATILERWRQGAQLVFASAATIALSRHSLPVYEIHKVGRPLAWADGLDLLGGFGMELAIIPHWNNAEGGTHDTRACFMGMERLERLRALLPATAVVLGIDEHTAITINLTTGSAKVRGRGGVSILRRDGALRIETGGSRSLDVLQPEGSTAPAAGRRPEARPLSAPDTIGQAAARIGAGDLPGGLRLAADGASPGMAALLLQASSVAQDARAGDDEVAPLLQILIDLRVGLRERGEWALADGLRDRLLAIGIELRDTPQGTTWVRQGG